MEIQISSLRGNNKLLSIANECNTNIVDDKIDSKEYSCFILKATKCYKDGFCSEEEFINLLDINDNNISDAMCVKKENNKYKNIGATAALGSGSVGAFGGFSLGCLLMEKLKFAKHMSDFYKNGSIVCTTIACSLLAAIGGFTLLDKIYNGKLSKANTEPKQQTPQKTHKEIIDYKRTFSRLFGGAIGFASGMGLSSYCIEKFIPKSSSIYHKLPLFILGISMITGGCLFGGILGGKLYSTLSHKSEK